MATVYVTRRATFNAAHRLHNPDRSDDWNRRTFGKCNSPNWHGHNYVLEVTVAGAPSPETGYVVDLGDVSRVMNEEAIDALDHRNLNLDVPWLAGILPSTENLAVAIWGRLAPRLPGLFEVRLRETDNNSAAYRGE
jgi:6-pyruvoyltetrahydropterin/6-carboxytetrahydropterin synthase